MARVGDKTQYGIVCRNKIEIEPEIKGSFLERGFCKEKE